ncbi:MAG: hypothetical protein JNM98_09555, partial [Rhodocyclaceae bacterium]|nr:hypothetical protein [Rhodocyclaceae bacterium]
FNQSGTVHVTAGSFVPNNGTDSGATYIADAGTMVDYSGGTRTLSGTITYDGAGTARLSGATWALSGPVSLSGTGTLDLASGTIGAGTLASDLAVQVSGTPLINGTQWTNNGGLDVVGSGALLFANGALLTNAAGGSMTLDSSAATPLGFGGGAASHLVNQGLLVQQATGNHAIDANLVFDNAGTVQVAAGTLQVASGADSGSYALANGATLEYAAGTRTVGTGASYTGAGGTVLLSGATVNVTAPVSISQPAVQLTGGSLGGSGGTSISSSFSASGGAVTGNLTTSGSTQITGSPQLNGGSWSNTGTLAINASGALLFTNGGHLTNQAAGTVALNSSAAEPIGFGGGATGVFDNFGILTQAAGGTHAINGNVTVNQGGQLLVDAGTLVAAGLTANSGNIRLASGATLQVDNGLANSGAVEGYGTIAAAGPGFVNSGLVSPGTTANPIGTLTIAGNYSNAAAGTLAMELAGNASGQYDTLVVTGDAVLGGTLAATEINGHLSDLTSSYTLLTAGSRSGNFSATNLPADIGWVISQTGDVVLSVASVITRWNSSIDGDWSAPSSWSRGVPNAGTDVVINNQGGTPVIHVSSGAQAAHSLTTDAQLSVEGGSLSILTTANLSGGTTLSGGTLDFGGAASLSSLNLSGGLLTGAGAITVGGPFAWSGGTLGGSGGFVTQAASSITGAAMTLDGRSWNNAPTGSIAWSGGDIAFVNSARIVNAGALAISGGAHSASGGRIDNTGSVVIAAASSLSVPTFNQQAGSITGQGGLTVSSDFNRTGGSVAGTLSDLDLTRPGDFVTGSLSATNSVRLVAGGALIEGPLFAAPTLPVIAAPSITLVAAGNIGASGAPLRVSAGIGVDAQSTGGGVYLQAPGALPLRLASAAGAVNLVAGGAISDANGSGFNVVGTSAHLVAANGIGNGDALETQVAQLSTQNSSGSTQISNVGALDIQGMSNVGGNILVDNIGGIITSGAVTVNGGIAMLVAHSPITVGSPGIDASGGIILTAEGSSAGDTITLNGPLSSSGGNITLTAGASIAQNSSITASAPASILARANSGDIVLDPLASTSVGDNGSIRYEAPLGHVLADPSQFFGAIPVFIQLEDTLANPLLQQSTNDVVVLLFRFDQIEQALDSSTGAGTDENPQQRRIGQCAR